MSFYVIRTLPKGVKITNLVALGDLTEEVMVTNAEGIAKSTVDGSRRPMVAINEEGLEVFDNLARVNAPFFRRRAALAKKVPPAPESGAKKGPKSRRETIVERV